MVVKGYCDKFNGNWYINNHHGMMDTLDNPGLLNWITTSIIKIILYELATNDYTLIFVDEPNVIGINERMVND